MSSGLPNEYSKMVKLKWIDFSTRNWLIIMILVSSSTSFIYRRIENESKNILSLTLTTIQNEEDTLLIIPSSKSWSHSYRFLYSFKKPCRTTRTWHLKCTIFENIKLDTEKKINQIPIKYCRWWWNSKKKIRCLEQAFRVWR